MRSTKISQFYWVVPFLFLVTLTLALGLQLFRLGFYWDDWPVMYLTQTQGASEFWEFYRYDRPISAWTYLVTTPLLGTNPLGWHIYSLLLRWLTTTFLWLTLCELWPEKRSQAAWVALLFAIYPSFDQQAISVAFSQHWTCYLLYMLSLWSMVRALRRESRAYTLVSILLAVLHLWTMEYFAGLELIRPLVIFLLVAESGGGWRKMLGSTLKKGLPYLLVFVGFVIWRIFLLEFPGEDPNPLVVFAALREEPTSAVLQLVQVAFKDTVYIIFGVWQKTIAGRILEFDSPFFRRAFVVSLFGAGLFWIFFRKRPEVIQAPSRLPWSWEYQAMGVGVVAILAGTLPAWLAGRQVTASFFSSRFALASMFGAALLLVGLLDWITPRYLVKLTLVAAMLFVSTNYHVRLGDQYRKSWDWQKEFYWQLAWRAPAIQPHTPLISDNEVLLYAGGYATALGINLAYGQGTDPGNVPYWFFNLDDKLEGQMDRFNARKALRAKLRIIEFSGKSFDRLVIDYDGSSCLKVHESGRPENALLPVQFKKIIPGSSIDRILPHEEPHRPDSRIFGPEPEHTWCYYYQKAELARQQGDWERIASLGDRAQALGYAPEDRVEWIVFIEGYTLAGRLETASTLTVRLSEDRRDLRPVLCQVWEGMAHQQPSERDLVQAYISLAEHMGCWSD